MCSRRERKEEIKMFEGLKKMFSGTGDTAPKKPKLKSGFKYVCDMPTIWQYMKESYDIGMEEELESIDQFYLYYHDTEYYIEIDNYDHHLAFRLDGQEYRSLEEFKEKATVQGTRLADIQGYVRIVLPYYDNELLNEYKKQHPNAEPTN